MGRFDATVDSANKTADICPAFDSKRRNLCFAAGLGLLLAIGIFFRLGAAWLMRHTTNPDFGIVALMAKHMSEGIDWPVFFYGQAYMGSLEPSVSAIFCKLFGFSGFAVCLGTVFFGVLLLIMVYLAAARIGGRKTGLFALALCVLGPGGYIHYMSSPRGGYALLLLLIVLLLERTIAIVQKEKSAMLAGWASFFVLGGLAGIGWWTNQMIAPAILASVLMILFSLRRQAFRWRTAGCATTGFLLGSAPFWAWNIVNGWWSFDFIETIGKPLPFKRGASFLLRHTAEMFDAVKPGWVGILFWCLLVVVLVYGLQRLVRAVRRRDFSPDTLGLIWIYLCVGIYSWQFSRSSYAELNTPRYVLPMVPLLAILAGRLLARLTDWSWKGWLMAAIPLAAILSWQAMHTSFLWRLNQQGEVLRTAGLKLESALKERNISACYLLFPQHALNYLLDERVLFTDLRGDRYQPYSDRIEVCDSPAILAGAGRPDAFLRAASGTAESCGPGELVAYCRFKAPDKWGPEIPPSQIMSLRDSAGQDWKQALTDGVRNTGFLDLDNAPERWNIEATFAVPVLVGGVRFLLPENGTPPLGMRIWGRESAQAEWKPVTDELAPWSMYWSGPRPYHGGAFFRQEARIPEGRWTELRIEFCSNDKRRGVRVSELQFFSGAGQATVSEQEALPLLPGVLNELGIRQLFADRWVSAKVNESGKSKMAVRDPATIRFARVKSRVVMNLNRNSAFLVRGEDEGMACRVLDSCGIKMSTRIVGPWMLFYFEKADWKESYSDSGLNWVGCGPVRLTAHH